MAETNLPETKARFIVSGNGLDLSEIEATLGLKPTFTQKAGSRVASPPLPRVDLWILDSSSEETTDGTKAIVEIVTLLERSGSSLRKVMAMYPEATFDITLVASSAPDPFPIVPYVKLTHQLLTRLAGLSVQLIFDFTILRPESDV